MSIVQRNGKVSRNPATNKVMWYRYDPTGYMLMWLRHNVGIYYDVSNYVRQWNDYSDAGRTAQQSVGANQPIYTGANGVSFDGSNDFLYTIPNGTPTWTGDMTIGLWYTFAGTPNGLGTFLSWAWYNNYGYDGWTLRYYSSGGPSIEFQYTGQTVSITPFTYDTNVFHHLGVCKSGSRVAIYFDGMKKAHMDITLTPGGHRTGMYVGNSQQVSSVYPHYGNLDDIRVYNGYAMWDVNAANGTHVFTPIPRV